MMTHRDKLEQKKYEFETTHEKVVRDHEKLIEALDSLISCTDPKTGMWPEAIVALMGEYLKNELATKALADVVETPTLEDAIYRLMEAGQETYFTADKHWSARQIYYMLESREYPFPQGIDAGINAVSAVLIRMADKGTLERTVKGSGRSPSLYRWIRAEDRPATTARNFINLTGWEAAGPNMVEPADVYSVGIYRLDANKGGSLGVPLNDPSAFERLLRKEKEAPEEAP